MAKPLHILILEDNSADAELENFELQEAGIDFVSRVVATEKEYLRDLQKFSPDIILSDYDLPGFTAVQALAAAKAKCPDTPFILVTGAISEDKAIDILTSGARDYVMKSRLQRLGPAVNRAMAEIEELRARRSAEEDLKRAHRELEKRVKQRTADLEAELATMSWLQKIGTLYIHEGNSEAVLTEIVDAAIAISGADFGNIQLLDPKSSTLKIAAYRGFPKWWLDYWSNVSEGSGVCGTALEKGERVMVEDVEKSPIFAGTDALQIQLKAGIHGVQSTPLVSRSGKPLGMFSTHYKIPHRPDEKALRRLDLLARHAADIIEWVNAESALRRMNTELEQRVVERTAELNTERQRFMDVLDILPAYVILLTTDYHVPFANRFFEERFGKSEGRRCYEYLFSRTEPCEICETYSVLKTRQRHEWEWTGPDGRDYYIFDFPFKDVDGSDFILEMGLDITDNKKTAAELEKYRHQLEEIVKERTGQLETANVHLKNEIAERRETEQALRESEKRFFLLFEKAAFAIALSLPPDGALINVNDEWVRMFGYSREEAIGKSAGMLNIIRDPEARMRVLEKLDRNGYVRNEEMTLFTKEGNERIFSINLHYADIDGRKHFISSYEDITERKRADKQLAEQSVALQERTAQLEEINKELESFSYSVSHDLRAPLRAIDGYSKMLLRDVQDKLDNETKQRLAALRENSQKMGQLIDDLLAFSRLGRQPVSLSVVDMQKLVGQVWDEMKSQNPERKMELEAGDLPQIQGDQTLLKQVLSNLMSNAVKFAKSRETALVRIGAMQEENEIVYHIEDNGVGFDMEYYKNLFGVFQRLHDASEYDGTGIGLSIVQRIIHKHGGRVWAESLPDRGATFYFSLPTERT
ncbi:MAG TPA: ATP-binding protein [Smithella sp.]|nr:ATP-binding protein [Smithella sp.]